MSQEGGNKVATQPTDGTRNSTHSALPIRRKHGLPRTHAH
jgi:hypothetical protein